ncbi:MAG TPA: 1,4-alpha-glucan branching protein GlgB [Solirubrobacteraceae bacterium]|jgi:1,4-alpha-glucan branching enzyme|nr:1,4-alpha-glucan branching protein GlgB [Solirubrobacteraceae bacterium]
MIDSTTPKPPVSTADLDRLVARDHHDPHSVLGAHASIGGVTIRTLQPAAQSVVVQPHGVELERIHPGGLFGGELPGASLEGLSAPLRYELEVRYADGGTFVTRDPYGFAPTLTDLDEHLFREGRHEQLWSKMGAHVREIDGVTGTSFAVWAPAARSVSVVGDFNFWDGRLHMMRALGGSGIWELFIPAVGDGARYKFEIRAQSGELLVKADPFAFRTELPPQTASIVHDSAYAWNDADYLAARATNAPYGRPMSVYEVHLGSWRLNPLEDNRSLTYRELADELAAYVADLGFTHVELMPVMGHPFSGSWGYQVTSYYAPTPRFGEPDEFKAFVDRMHEHGIGVILDWVPAHFPRDDWALARFDGTALYEHEDPRRGSHPDWGTLVFNYGRNEVRNFLLANALFWAREYHCDGIRVDAVASMLYRDYSRKAGEWVPNEFGGREDLEAVAFLKELNEVLHREEPGVISAAEESTAWPGVSRPTYLGGLGFGFKWNMGWMHDTLGYFQEDPIHRRYHHHELTFSLIYAFTENFILPLSHDEVVHGKGSLIDKMPGDRWQKLANLRTLYAFMWAHPGKKLLFMGQEFAQSDEWSHARSLDWHLLEYGEHAGVQALIRDLNGVLRDTPALYEVDFDGRGFYWIEPNDADANVVAFARAGEDPGSDVLVCIANLSPVPRPGYRLGLPRSGRWVEALNSDSGFYGGTDTGNLGGVDAEPLPWHGQPCSAEVTLPPLGVVWLVPEREPEIAAPLAGA